MATSIYAPHILLSIFSIIILFASSIATSVDSPFMVAHKKVSLSRLKSGSEQISVSIDIYNKGSSTGYDLSLDDNTWPQDTFDLISGTPSKTWEKLESGSIVTHSFVLESKVKGLFHAKPAVIKFRIPTKASLQEAYSTTLLPLDILADKPQVKKLDIRLVASYGSLISVVSSVAIFAYLIASPSKSSKKRR
ncbi:putative Translocon-associated protein, beta subunit [Zostera marina]|uniref:Putative Translocon-associated protein, beta subunit n=1 Tax=Zostera marina TaxID=29655 RepID=A0A0K9NX28_ZOSMR|nr:putative Translocon-associated protein, beta subunit [Zostera marina]